MQTTLVTSYHLKFPLYLQEILFPPLYRMPFTPVVQYPASEWWFMQSRNRPFYSFFLDIVPERLITFTSRENLGDISEGIGLSCFTYRIQEPEGAGVSFDKAVALERAL